MNVELMRDGEREHGWWLLVDGSEQSFIDTVDPLHLEFEYVQMVAQVLEVLFDDAAALTALHLGGGLCTIPRWIAARHPGSVQRVVEHSGEIAALSASLGEAPGTTVVLDDALAVVGRSRPATNNLLVCDVYEGPHTVTELFALPAVTAMRSLLEPGGVFVANLSDSAPFALARVVVATLRELFDQVVLMAEPATLRGRRSGNLVVAATDRAIPLDDLAHRAAGGPVRFRVMAGRKLEAFVGDARAVSLANDLPRSGESANRTLI